MKISLINGSPKMLKSNSEILGNYLLSLLDGNEIKKYYSLSFNLNDNTRNEIYNSEVLIFIFPFLCNYRTVFFIKILIY